jgi:hypothetical protein
MNLPSQELLKAVVLDACLAPRWLMAVEAVDAVPGVVAQLVFSHDRVLLLPMARGHFPEASTRAEVGCSTSTAGGSVDEVRADD